MKTGFIIFKTSMYVCVCHAVTESEVDAAILAGAHSREAVTRACGAGGDCGSCHGMIEMKIEDHLETAVSGIISCPSPRQPLAPVHADLVPVHALVRTRGTRAA